MINICLLLLFSFGIPNLQGQNPEFDEQFIGP